MKRSLLIGIALLALVASAVRPTSGSAQTESGWTIKRFDAAYTIRDDSTIVATEEIEVDFEVERHGIFRDFVTDVPCDTISGSTRQVADCPAGLKRHYEYSGFAVTDAAGQPVQVKVLSPESTSSGVRGTRLRLGDPDRTVTGRQTYRISYLLRGALDAFEDRDELFWNATGSWPVSITTATVSVTLALGQPPAATECFEGSRFFSRPCRVATDTVTTFAATRTLGAGEELTIGMSWPKGALSVPAPMYSKDRTFGDNFTFDALELGTFALFGPAAVLAALGAWWTRGRDRRFRTVPYLSGERTEETALPFSHETVVVEFKPPDDLRPAQLTMVMNEESRTRDVTATIVDLAVRGHLRITEEKVERTLAPDSVDWLLERTKTNDGGLLKYEKTLLDGLFQSGDTVRISSLKRTFAARLAKVRREIVGESVQRGWFRRSPDLTTGLWLGAGIGLAVAGGGLTYLCGKYFDRALMGVPLAAGGLVLAACAPSMPARTPSGSETRRRAAGFRLYVETAETRQQEFNEQQNLFAAYLPYAIAFDCVDKWAKAFAGLAAAAAASTAGWYVGSGVFDPGRFGSSMNSFTSGVGSALATSASSSGGGGGSFGGGGGGGGGGGSW